MKGRALEIYCRAVTQPADHIWMAHTVQRHGFILKVYNQRSLEVGIRGFLKEHVQCLDNYSPRPILGGSVVVRHVDLGITAATEAFNNVIAAVKSALL